MPIRNKKKRIFAAILIIGDEILSGRTQDTNTSFIAKWLNDRGVQLKEVRIIPDDLDTIVSAVNLLRKKYNYLFTTGGIGPTHDDITAFAISRAFKKKYEYNKEAYQILERHYKDSYFNEARKKMAKMPRSAGLIYNPSSSAPGFYLKNVFTLPGVPTILKSMMPFLEPLIIGGEKVYSVTVQSHLPESKIGKDLGKLQKRFKDLSLGSYPFFQSGKVGVALVIRGYSQAKIKECKIILEKILKKIKKS
jgi:molybdenum cofactor synthesis domain-containing protein